MFLDLVATLITEHCALPVFSHLIIPTALARRNYLSFPFPIREA